MGWFADPTGRFGQRWYDGATWTDWVIGANGAKIQDPLAGSAQPRYPWPAAPGAPVGPARYAPGIGLAISAVGVVTWR